MRRAEPLPTTGEGMLPTYFWAMLLAVILGVGALLGAGLQPAVAVDPATEATYDVLALGVLPGDNQNEAYDINDAAQVVGHSESYAEGRRAFIYDKGIMKELGALPGGSESEAWGLNNSGQVIGVASDGTWSNGTGGVLNMYPFLYEGGTMKRLATVTGDSSFVARNITNSGQIAGTMGPEGNTTVALYDPNSGLQNLGRLAGTSDNIVMDSNDSGQIVGYASGKAFLYENGTMTDLGTLPATGWTPSASARAINSLGQVVGLSGGGDETTSPPQGFGGHPFLWDEANGMQDLGTLGGDHGAALDINDSGQIVGFAMDSETVPRAFIYENGVMRDLNGLIPPDSDWHLEQATAINNKGDIVGYGRLKGGDGSVYAFLLTSPETTSAQLRAGGTLTSDTENDGATISDPVETSVTTPIAGAVSVTERLTIRPSSTSGYSFFGRQINIAAPIATASDPLVLKFVLDRSVIPAGEDASTIQISRNGTLMEACTGASGAASPDPCVAARSALEGGDAELTVRTSHASRWNLAGSDRRKPSVKTPFPTTGATGVSRKANVTATFSEEMNPNTVTLSTAKLINTATNTQVGATVSCVYPCRTVTINPKVDSLSASTKFKAIITTGTKDLGGNPLDQNRTLKGNQQKVWTFTTK